MSFLPNCSLQIYLLPDTTTPVWNGTTDINGRAIDINGQPPNLRYGNYRTISSHCDYNDEIYDFTIPGTSVINMSQGCTSSITTHETIYDHSKLASINTDLLAGLTPTLSGFTQNPSPLGELTDNNWNDFTTTGIVQSRAAGPRTGTITYNLGTLKHVSIIIADLKFQLSGWNYSSFFYPETASLRINVWNGIQWNRMYENTRTESGSQTAFDSGVITASIPIYYYDNLSQIQIELYVDSGSSPATPENSTVTLYGRRLRAIG